MTPPLEELRFVDTADVYKAGRPRRTPPADEDQRDLRVRSDYLTEGGPAVATTLPLSGKTVRTHAAGALPPFFAGLLPEGRRLTALRQAVKTSADDEFSLLLAVAADAIGDVQVVVAGEPPVPAEPRLTVGSWSGVRFARLFAEAAGRPGIDRVALPGVQDKVSARVMSLPVATAEARFILKLNPPEYPHLVENEAFFIDAARRSGLATVDAEVVHDATGAAGLLVRRFDRAPVPGGGTRMLAQEDAAQVLGRYPADKYNVWAEEVTRALAGVARARAVAAREILRQLVFAYLTGNGDAHAKNFSVLHDGEWRVTAAYDLPSTQPYGDVTMALPLAGRIREDVGREHFLGLAEAAGVRPRAAAKAIDDLVARVPGWMERLDELPFGDRRIHRLRRAVQYRLDRLTAR